MTFGLHILHKNKEKCKTGIDYCADLCYINSSKKEYLDTMYLGCYREGMTNFVRNFCLICV